MPALFHSTALGNPGNQSKDECRCSRTRVSSVQKVGLCSDWADSRGQSQRVISYSIYGSLQSSYFKGIRLNLKGVEQFYPGYTMRLYHNADESQTGFKELCDIYCQSNTLDLCNVRHIGKRLLFCYQSLDLIIQLKKAKFYVLKMTIFKNFVGNV